ncbi:unnamed protein product, partial [Phaeothamnion confervicola]
SFRQLVSTTDGCTFHVNLKELRAASAGEKPWVLQGFDAEHKDCTSFTVPTASQVSRLK